jgi:hypothetical protein
VIANFRERLSVRKRDTEKLKVTRLDFKKLNNVDVKEQNKSKIANSCVTEKCLLVIAGTSIELGKTLGRISILVRESVRYYTLKR